MKATRGSVYYRLATMLDAGLPLPRSLELALAGISGGLRSAFARVERETARGGGISEAMAAHPRRFSPVEILLVRVGEESGRLSECLRILSNWYEFRERQLRTIISGLLLPAVILHAAAFVIPLPSFILGRLSMADYVRHVAGILLVPYLLAALAATGARFAPNRGRLRRLWDHLVLAVPLVKAGLRQLALSRYFRALAMLEGAGAPIVRSTRLAAEVGGNSVVMDLVRGGAASAERGEAVSEGFSTHLEQEYLDVFRVGEMTGTISEASGRLADAAAERAQGIFEELSRWVPRLVYFGLCIFLAMHIVMAFYGVMQRTGR